MNLIKTHTLTPWDVLDRLAPWNSHWAFSPTNARSWAPALDVFETPEEVTVELELAGMKKEDFDISLEEETLTISGRREGRTGGERGESFRNERFFGTFRRVVTLPSAVKADGITATYKDGILSVRLPKADEAKPRKIEVQLN